MTAESLIAVGRIVKSRGLAGEVVVFPLSDDPSRFASFDHVVVTDSNGTASTYKLSLVRLKPRKGGAEVHVKLDGVDSREASDLLRGSTLSVTKDQLPLGEDEHFLFDLVGLKVTTSDNTLVGTVKDVREHPGQNLIVIDGGERGEVLIPDVPEFIDKRLLDEGILIVNPIEGLLD